MKKAIIVKDLGNKKHKDIISMLKKDESGLYKKADNYQECRKGIDNMQKHK